jgi:hypothetical protein
MVQASVSLFRISHNHACRYTGFFAKLKKTDNIGGCCGDRIYDCVRLGYDST